MKWKIVSLTALLVAPAFADHHEEGEKKKPDAAKPGLFEILDRNRDGKLQQQEIDMAVVLLRRMDKNQDGDVSKDELVAPQGRPDGGGTGDRPGAGGQRRMPTFADLDEDGDGKISKEEAPERMKERFGQMDGNGDGFIDKAEQEEIMKRMRERFRGGAGGQRPNQQRRDRPQQDADPSGGAKPKRPPLAE